MSPVTRSQQNKENENSEELSDTSSVASTTISFHGFGEWEATMDETTKNEYEKAVRQRSQVKSKLVRIKRTLAQNKSIGLAQLNVLSKGLNATYAEYKQLHTTIVGLVPVEAMEEQENEYEDFEGLHYDASNVVEALILAAKAADISLVPPANSTAPQVVIQQQPLKAPIPTFDGSYAAWPKFKAIFQDLMANSGDSDAIKLYHLDKALIGEAAGVLDTKVLSEGDYDDAWDILTDRFENERIIVETHIRGLLTLKKMMSESHRELRVLLNEATRHVESLRYVEQAMTSVSEHIIVYLIISALDKSTRKAWEGTQKKGDPPKYSQTITFLKSRCQILENCEAAFHTANPTVKPKQIQPLPKNPPQKSHAASTTTVSQECEICGGAHRNNQCTALSNMTRFQKNERIRAAGVCFNCLRKGHRIKDCPSDKSCRKCQRRHHTLLHDDGASSYDTKPNVPLSAESMISLFRLLRRNRCRCRRIPPWTRLCPPPARLTSPSRPRRYCCLPQWCRCLIRRTKRIHAASYWTVAPR